MYDLDGRFKLVANVAKFNRNSLNTTSNNEKKENVPKKAITMKYTRVMSIGIMVIFCECGQR